MSLFTSYMHLYCFGLAFLTLIFFVGKRTFKGHKVIQSEYLLLGYIIVIAIYAIVKTEGATVAWFLLLWLIIYRYWTKNEIPNKDSISTYRQLVVISSLWTIIFLLKAIHFWNNEYAAPNLHFEDYPYYMKLVEGFNLYGFENGMGHLNLFINDTKFLQPYRSNDLWLNSIGLDITKYDTIYIWELFYSPVLLTLVGTSIFFIIDKKVSVISRICISTMALFVFSGQWFRGLINVFLPEKLHLQVDFGILAYPKLFLVYAFLFIIISMYFKNRYINALLWCSILPIFVQTTLALVPFSLMIMTIIKIRMIRDRNQYFDRITLYFINLTMILLAFIFTYYWNSYLEFKTLGFIAHDIINFNSFSELFFNFIKSILYFTGSYYIIPIIIMGYFYFEVNNISHTIKNRLSLLLLILLFTTVGVYSFYKHVGDSIQFTTNIMIPTLIVLIIYFFLNHIEKIFVQNKKIIFFTGMFIVSFYQVYGKSNPFHSTQKIKRYSPLFIKEMKYELSQLDHEYGVYYYNPEEDVPYKEHFPLAEAAFLKLFGRNYDVFNISGWRLKEEQFSFEQQKYCVFTARQSINLLDENLEMFSFETDVLSIYRKYYPFSYCLSKTPLDQLPLWLSNEISYSVCDERSEVYYYKFKS